MSGTDYVIAIISSGNLETYTKELGTENGTPSTASNQLIYNQDIYVEEGMLFFISKKI